VSGNGSCSIGIVGKPGFPFGVFEFADQQGVPNLSLRAVGARKWTRTRAVTLRGPGRQEGASRASTDEIRRLRVASYKGMRKHHTETKHQYLVPRSFLESDVVISIPKLKTHRGPPSRSPENFMGFRP